jgi:hypothetical protein
LLDYLRGYDISLFGRFSFSKETMSVRKMSIINGGDLIVNIHLLMISVFFFTTSELGIHTKKNKGDLRHCIKTP